MFSSTIIPTIGRPTLARAVQSVLDQEFHEDDFEIIVVNDSGKPLPEEDWQKSERVHVLSTNRCERSTARNTGAATAKGRFLHFLDDDDILLPGALAAFWHLAHTAQPAVWLYGSWRTVDNDGKLINQFSPHLNGNIFAPLVAGEGLPLQASLLKSEAFFMVGAYDASPVLIGVEDRDICRRLAFLGNVAYTPYIVAQVRIGEAGSSTNWKLLAEGDRRGREKVLDCPKAYERVHDSVRSSDERSYLSGLVCRTYIASAVWNLQSGRLLVALSRFLASFAINGLQFLSGEFWEGMRNIRYWEGRRNIR